MRQTRRSIYEKLIEIEVWKRWYSGGEICEVGTGTGECEVVVPAKD